MGASCARRSKSSFLSEGRLTDEDLKSAGFDEGAQPSRPKLERSLSRLGSRILLAETKGRSPEEGYDIQKEVGVGGFGVVRLGRKHDTKRMSAIKTVKKKDTDKAKEALQNEVAICLDLDHPHIVKLYDVYEDNLHAHLAMELCDGGEVLDVITAKGKFGEKDAAMLTHQLLQGVTYLHFKGVCHRDLKLENMLLLDKDVPIRQNTMKLIDFGLSRRFVHGRREMMTKAGSALYVAPEVLHKTEPYSEVCDVWSCGCILFIMLSGSPPFGGKSNSEILKKLLKSELTFPEKRWSRISAEAKACVQQLMVRRPAERPSAEVANRIPWLQELGHHSDADSPSHEDCKEYFEHLQEFSKLNSFARVAKHLVAHRVGQHEVESLRVAFERLDQNQDGVLSLEEMMVGVAEAGLEGDPTSMKEVFKRIDTDSSGQVDYTEFVAGAMEQRFFQQQELCQEAFDVFDQNHDGDITVDELKDVLKTDGIAASKLGKRALEKILAQADQDGDHKINFSEFVTMLNDAEGGLSMLNEDGLDSSS